MNNSKQYRKQCKKWPTKLPPIEHTITWLWLDKGVKVGGRIWWHENALHTHMFWHIKMVPSFKQCVNLTYGVSSCRNLQIVYWNSSAPLFVPMVNPKNYFQKSDPQKPKLFTFKTTKHELIKLSQEILLPWTKYWRI